MKKKAEWLWDLWCIVSLIGIWPRFIEPEWLTLTRLSLPIVGLPPELMGLKILQFSDLHWSSSFSASLLKRLTVKINGLKPDLIFFTGDLFCRSKLEDSKRLSDFLCSLKASVASFAILGNHDYEKFVTINQQGHYGIEAPSTSSNIYKGFKRLFSTTPLSGYITPEARQINQHPDVEPLLHRAGFQLLNNTTQLVSYKGGGVNVCGLGEYTVGQTNPEQAFKNYQEHYPGIILCHNPDAIPSLLSLPGDLILCGHTHGGQVNLPFLWKKFTGIENLHFKRGLKRIGHKWIYVNRGIGSVMKFRWFSPPELTLLTLQSG